MRRWKEMLAATMFASLLPLVLVAPWATGSSVHYDSAGGGGSSAVGGDGVATSSIDMNGNDIILDADADTKIENGTDDTYDVHVGGASKYTLTATEATYATAVANIYVPDQVIFATDTDSMMRRRGTNDMEFRLAGTDILRISSTGVVVENGTFQVDVGVTTLTGGLRLPVQTAAAPSAPATCDASAKGRIEVVDDSDDTAATQVCYCGMTDDSTYDWLNIADGTACSFY